MRIITFQRKEVLDLLLENGEYCLKDRANMRTFNHFTWKNGAGFNTFQEVYGYIMDRMKKRIDPIDYDESIVGPIWGWYRYADMEELIHDNQGLWRIELEIDEKKVLLSDFDYYENVAIAGLDFIFNGNDKAARAIEAKAKEEGVEAIYACYDKMIGPWHIARGKWIQATFWKLKKEEIVSYAPVEKREKPKKEGPCI